MIMGPEWQKLLSALRRGDRRALSRLISLVEARVSGWQNAMHDVFAAMARASVVGITGSPGSGKSTLTGRVALEFSKRGRMVGIIAIDPTSPFSGGAILGDRIRMTDLNRHGVYLRSMATRGARGGLSRATRDTVRILAAFGFDLILIETVGAGQDEVDVLDVADIILVTAIPGQGDSLQAIKAGIMEIADIFIVNKADRPGADTVAADIQAMLRVTRGGAARQGAPAILKTVATTGAGVPEVIDALVERLAAAPSGNMESTEAEIREVVEMINAQLCEDFWNLSGAEDELRRHVGAYSRVDPYELSSEILPEGLMREALACVRARRGR